MFLSYQGDRKWRKCPICYESIYRLDLKRCYTDCSLLPSQLALSLSHTHTHTHSVSALSMAQYSPGDVISMRQMVREKGSTLVRPSSHRPHSPHALPSLSGVLHFYQLSLPLTHSHTHTHSRERAVCQAADLQCQADTGADPGARERGSADTAELTGP